MDINEELNKLYAQYKVYTPQQVPDEQLAFPFMEDNNPELWVDIN